MQEQLDLMTNLFQLQWVQQVLLAASYRRKQFNSMEYVYRSCGVLLQPLLEESLESQIILQYIRTAALSSNKNNDDESILSVKAIFKIGSNAMDGKAKSGPPGRLLWHGTTPGSVLSILRHGLLVYPPGIARCQIFGRGVYLADTLDKSFQYCVMSRHRSWYALLCQVNLNDAQVSWNAYNSDDEDTTEIPPVKIVKGQCGPESHGDIVLQDGEPCVGCDRNWTVEVASLSM